MAASAMPPRWAFEGLLLLESPHHPSDEGWSRNRTPQITISPKTFSPPIPSEWGPPPTPWHGFDVDRHDRALALASTRSDLESTFFAGRRFRTRYTMR